MIESQGNIHVLFQGKILYTMYIIIDHIKLKHRWLIAFNSHKYIDITTLSHYFSFQTVIMPISLS